MKKIGIYKIVNSINNKLYIGSSNDIKSRISSHKNKLKKGKHHSIKLQRAVNKYGICSFVFEIIEECNIDELLTKEQYYINLFDSYNNGYNSTQFAGRPMLGKKHTDEAKKKISNHLKTRTGDKNSFFGKKHSSTSIEKMKLKLIGQTRSDEVKQKMSESAKNKPPMSKETKQKLREINLGKKYETKPIIQIDIYGNEIKEWEGISICAKELNINISGISKVLTGISKTTKGYKFKYKND